MARWGQHFLCLRQKHHFQVGFQHANVSVFPDDRHCEILVLNIINLKPESMANQEVNDQSISDLGLSVKLCF